MTGAVVRLWLKVMDPTALTARETLQRLLGFGDRVREVHRSEVWGFRWKEERNLQGALDRVVRETNLLQNPNKHRVEIAHGPEPLCPRGNAWVLVAAPGGGSELSETLARHRLVTGEIPRTARGTLWELDLEGSEKARRALAEAIAVVRSRHAGLLANPHLEDAFVFNAPPRAQDLVERFPWREQARTS